MTDYKDGDTITVNGKPCRIEGGALVPEPIPVSAIGQIKIGDVLLICDDHSKSQYKVQDILPPTKDHGEEVILDIKKNLFFSTNLVLSGESWAKRVFIVERAPITLTLTREQVELIQLSLNATLEKFGYFSNDQYTLREMIKEKLSK